MDPVERSFKVKFFGEEACIISVVGTIVTYGYVILVDIMCMLIS